MAFVLFVVLVAVFVGNFADKVKGMYYIQKRIDQRNRPKKGALKSISGGRIVKIRFTVLISGQSFILVGGVIVKRRFLYLCYVRAC